MEEKHLKPHQILAAQRYIENKTQIPLPNMIYKDIAPFISIMGPSKTGKSTLFHKLIQSFTKNNKVELLNDRMITISNSQNKLTFFDCPSNLESYIDCSKVSDLVILTINANNLEIDTFEIISLLKAHGMTKIIIGLVNCDRKSLKKIKKRLWKEITPGLKIYDLKIGSEIEKMVRNIKQMKFRPLQWRCSNSYVIVDKIEYEKCQNNAYLYGFVRGCPFNADSVHIPGQGDFQIEYVKKINDPCAITTKKLLDKEKIAYYSPTFYGMKKVDEILANNTIVDESDSTTDEFLLYKDNKVYVSEEIVENNEITTNKKLVEDMIKKENNDEKTEDRIAKNILISHDEKLVLLKNKLKGRFEEKPESEEDYINKFNEKESTQKTEQPTDKQARMFQEIKNQENKKGFTPGDYIEIKIKNINNRIFNPLTIVGANLNTKELYLQGRVKRINYFPYILKSNENYLISIGWRRELSNFVFSLKDTTRNRYLKYILDNTHCNVNFISKLVQPRTSFCIIKEKTYARTVDDKNKDLKKAQVIDKIDKNYKITNNFFRIAANGTITDVSGKTNLLKKLKLIGYPKKIMENTVFVKDMFSSDKEVTKFEGALLKTVSGLRGSIKKCVGKDGTFRATFEGRLLMSDIIFMRCYVPYDINNVKDDIYEKKKEKEQSSITHKNITEIVEAKKDKRKNIQIQKLTTKLTLDKQTVFNENQLLDMPIAPEQEDFFLLKNEINKKRKIIEENQNKKRIEIENKKEKEKKQLELQKKENLRKNILETKMLKNKKKKTHNKKRK